MASSPSIGKERGSNRSVAVISFFGGLGIAVGICAALAVVYWYGIHPPVWQSNAVRATFIDSGVLTIYPIPHEPNSIKFPRAQVWFDFDLLNKTGEDYTLAPPHQQVVAMQRLRANSLIDGSGVSWRAIKGTESIDNPEEGEKAILIPSGQAVRIVLTTDYDFYNSAENQPSAKELEAFGREQMKDIAGFVLLDQTHHYRIDLPFAR